MIVFMVGVLDVRCRQVRLSMRAMGLACLPLAIYMRRRA
jgi:hypothetical protein